MTEIDIYDILKWVLVPIAVAITAHQYRFMSSINDEVKTKVTEDKVRNLIDDKSEALHMADQNSTDRMDRMEDRINKIDEKLDQIVKMLFTMKGDK